MEVTNHHFNFIRNSVSEFVSFQVRQCYNNLLKNKNKQIKLIILQQIDLISLSVLLQYEVVLCSSGCYYPVKKLYWLFKYIFYEYTRENSIFRCSHIQGTSLFYISG